MPIHLFKCKDVEHGRSWAIESERAVVGFRYEITIGTTLEPVVHGWHEGCIETAPPVLLVGVLLSFGVTPEVLPDLPDPLNRLLARAQTAMIRECQRVAEAVETGEVTTSHTASEALAALLRTRAATE